MTTTETPTSEPAVEYSGPHPDLLNALPVDQQRQLVDIGRRLDEHHISLSITLGNLKGGVGKTTSSVYLSLILGIIGHDVLLVDGDGTNRSAMLWRAASAEWPSNVTVVSWAGQDQRGRTITGREMADRVTKVRSRYRHLVLDTGPQMREYLAAALKLSTDFVVTSSPNPADMQQIGEALRLAAEVEAMRADPLYSNILFTRVRRRTVSLREAYASMQEQGASTFDQAITQLESYASAIGSVPDDLGEYLNVLDELVTVQLEDEEETE